MPPPALGSKTPPRTNCEASPTDWQLRRVGSFAACLLREPRISHFHRLLYVSSLFSSLPLNEGRSTLEKVLHWATCRRRGGIAGDLQNRKSNLATHSGSKSRPLSPSLLHSLTVPPSHRYKSPSALKLSSETPNDSEQHAYQHGGDLWRKRQRENKIRGGGGGLQYRRAPARSRASCRKIFFVFVEGVRFSFCQNATYF